MIIRKIELSHYRNYADQEIVAEPGINVFFGDNAQGKTNILEAVYLCACARSHRTARDADLIGHGADQYGVKLTFVNRDKYEETLEIRYLEAVPGDMQRGRAMRLVYHNGVRLEKISDFIGLFHAVIFAPEDLMLVKEGPSTRRRYLDLLISQVRPTYFVRLQQYARYLQQRNKLLKDLRESGYPRQQTLNEELLLQIDVWNQSLAEQAAGLIEQRLIYADAIAELAAQAQDRISSGKEQLFVKYKTIAGIRSGMKQDEIFTIYMQKLKSMINEDIEKGSTGAGPHRDDLELSLDGDGLKVFASQGQQRSAVLALKLAELAVLRREIGEAPVLLLDDVMSELDESRRGSLLDNIQDSQVFVTCTDTQQIMREFRQEQLRDRQQPEQNQPIACFKVEQGHVFPG